MRYDFKKHTLEESLVVSETGAVRDVPSQLFTKWYTQAVKILGEDASAMMLATNTRKNPSARTVYLRGFNKKGYSFYTNYNSRKANDLKQNPNACLLFFWRELQRQVKIEGKVEKLSAKESDNYFASRPRNSQIGAWASPQSTLIPNREALNEWVKAFTKTFEGKKIPRPVHWGGYRLIPSYFEFWQGRESRLHDRIVFTKQKNGKWKMGRLAP